MAEIRPFQIESFEAEGLRLVEAAREQARQLLRAAVAERDRLLGQARQEGREAGLREGRETAAKAERERVAQETAGLRGFLEGLGREIDEKRVELAALAERELVRLAVAVAGKIVKAEVRAPGNRIAGENLRRAVELAARRQELQVAVNPADLAMVEAYLPDLRAAFADIQSVRLEPSEGVARGGCVVRTREGAVDADLRTQLEEIERGLLG